MVKKALLLLALGCLSSTLLAQGWAERIEPPHWWVGMAESELQLMLYGENIGACTAHTDGKAIQVMQTQTTDNPNYLFITLKVSGSAKPGNYPITLTREGKNKSFSYTLKPRRPGSNERVGFNSSDVLYLITPDRFANGNPKNDAVKGMLEGPDRDFKGGRHGGDIQGIRDHIDYIADMGFTAIWSCPLIENQQPEYSYHGYSTTDFYRIDPRMGSLEEYKALSAEAHAKGLKLVMDQIMNHMGSGHWWMQDHPSADWVNNHWEYKWNKHYRSTLHDPYSAADDSLSMTDGWFVESMPDLNQRNPLLAKYLIQNSIWWVEEADLDGIRMDTYPYSDKTFMAHWSCALMKEYPNFNIVGEEWTMNPAYIAYWQKGNKRGYPSCVPSMFDFPVQKALIDALTEEESWWGGWFKLYEAIAQDFQYADPYNLMIFPDNHDMDRFYRQIGKDLDRYKLGMTFIATTRGIPQVYYGTELLFNNSEKDDHGTIRIDFPGGWNGDEVNGFTGVGISPDQREAQMFTRRLLKWRKSATAVHSGELTHYGPKDGVYVYFRSNADQRIMVILNKNEAPYELVLDRFEDSLNGSTGGTNILSNSLLFFNESLSLEPMQAMVIVLK